MATQLATEKAIIKALAELTAEEKQEILSISKGSFSNWQQKQSRLWEIIDRFTASHCQLNRNSIRDGILDALGLGFDTVEKYELWMWDEKSPVPDKDSPEGKRLCEGIRLAFLERPFATALAAGLDKSLPDLFRYLQGLQRQLGTPVWAAPEEFRAEVDG